MKNKSHIILKHFLICLLFLITSCSSFASAGAPYQIKGEMVLEDSIDYENAGFEFSLFNRSDKEIKSFTVVFFLFDNDGNPPIAGKNNIVLEINETIEALENCELCVSLDKYLTFIPEEPYSVDFLYVSKIVYSDNSVWSDPFGLELL
ncbi:MAG: hypothetical protein MJ174_08695 [Treponema sp.]|nr:hypothetical protein [Treponema sp.]